MKNTMKTQAKNEVFEALAHYLTLRHAYTNEDEALIDCYTNSSEVIDTISKARMRGYLTALQDMYLMSINEATRVQDCIAHEVPKLTDDYLDFWMF